MGHLAREGLYFTFTYELKAAMHQTGYSLFCNTDFPRLFHDQKMKIHDLSVQQIFQSQWHMTYECIPELVVTVPAAHSTIIKKIKPLVYLHIFTNITTVQHDFTRCSWAPAASVKNYMTLWSFSMTFHAIPWPLLFSMTLQAWKMIFLNSMTRGHPDQTGFVGLSHAYQQSGHSCRVLPG